MTKRAEVAALQTTHHLIVHGDARSMAQVADESVHLVVTSPPYWTLKQYEPNKAQLGHVDDYESFHRELNRVWAECFRAILPGGRMCVVVGDVCLPRRRCGRHQVIPLHAAIQVNCVRLGFDNLAPIIWHKIGNIVLEASRSSHFLGKPYEPGAIIKNDIEYILFFRKPGDYRHPTERQRALSKMSKEEYFAWFTQIWTLRGQSCKQHPAPYPEELAYRLVRMFSFIDDTVLDPFLGSGTTTVASARAMRSSIGYEIEEKYLRLVRDRLGQQSLLSTIECKFVDQEEAVNRDRGDAADAAG
jgi:DNA modification methylase